MMRKLLMFVLLGMFILGIVFVFGVAKLKKSPTTIKVNLPIIPTVVVEPTALPTPEDPFVLQGKAIKEDIKMIKNDLEKGKKEDIRLLPPSFLFDI